MNNFEKIKSLTPDKMARFLEDKISLPFEIAIQKKRSRLNYIKRWLQQEVSE